jgi:hypothetical protein
MPSLVELVGQRLRIMQSLTLLAHARVVGGNGRVLNNFLQPLDIY